MSNEASEIIANYARKSGRQIRPKLSPRDKIVLRKFGNVAKVLWPEKTAAHLATLGGADERTGKRWMRGEGEPPISVVLACIEEMFRPIE